jgi:hypothetical protein
LRFEYPSQSLAQLDSGKEIQFGMEAPAVNSLTNPDSGCTINGSSPVILE